MATLLAVPVPAAAIPVAECVPSALPAAPDAADGGSVSAILAPGTYLGWMDGSPVTGVIWRDGAIGPLEVNPAAVNANGLVAGYVGSWSTSKAARMQLGGTPQVGASALSYLYDVNAGGDTVGVRTTAYFPQYWHEALWWRAGDASPTVLPGPVHASTRAIGDLGYIVGWGETAQGERRGIVWGPNGAIVRQYGPYAEGETSIAPMDVDDGTVAATRYPATGAMDIVLIDVVTGTMTPLADSAGYGAVKISEGSVLGMNIDADPRFVLWHDGVRYNLPSPPNTSVREVEDLKVFGTTAVLGGFSYPVSSGWFKTPTVWVCG